MLPHDSASLGLSPICSNLHVSNTQPLQTTFQLGFHFCSMNPTHARGALLGFLARPPFSFQPTSKTACTIQAQTFTFPSRVRPFPYGSFQLVLRRSETIKARVSFGRLTSSMPPTLTRATTLHVFKVLFLTSPFTCITP